MQDDTCTMMNVETNNSIGGQNTITDHDEGAENLDILLHVMDEQESAY